MALQIEGLPAYKGQLVYAYDREGVVLEIGGIMIKVQVKGFYSSMPELKSVGWYVPSSLRLRNGVPND